MMMVMCNKQHLSNIWSSIHGKLSNTEAELEKKLWLQKNVNYYFCIHHGIIFILHFQIKSNFSTETKLECEAIF